MSTFQESIKFKQIDRVINDRIGHLTPIWQGVLGNIPIPVIFTVVCLEIKPRMCSEKWTSQIKKDREWLNSFLSIVS